MVQALQQSLQSSEPARWWLLLIGGWLVLWTGYLGAKAFVMVHAAVWRVRPPRVRNALLASLTFSGTSLLFALSLVVAHWVRVEAPGLGLVATLALIVVPFGLWLVVSRRLPPGDLAWSELVPGAAVVAIGIQGLHVFTVYYLLPTLDNTTELYGALGLVSTFLFWLYIIGRLVIGGATVTVSYRERRNGAADEGEAPDLTPASSEKGAGSPDPA